MKYIKAYFSAFFSGLKFFGIIYLVLAILRFDNFQSLLFLYYSIMTGIAGPIRVAIDEPEKVNKNV